MDLNSITSSVAFPYIFAGIITILLSLLGLIVYQLFKRTTNQVDYSKQLQELIESDYDEGIKKSKTKISLLHKWNKYWSRLFKEIGMTRYASEQNTAGRDVIIVGVVVAVISSLILRNPLLGIGIAVALIVVTGFLIHQRIDQKSNMLNKQLPGFIAALKSQIQASQTNERAMLEIVDTMPSPLREDLKIVKNKLLASSSFREALEELSHKTASNELKFLAACMIQATTSGANLESQLDSIQAVLKSRQLVNSEINRGVSATKPATWVASIAIPAYFILSYFISSTSREFWFVEPMSYIAIIAVIALWGLGMWTARQQVEKIKNI